MKVLNVAEKNDAAKNIAEILGKGRINRREGLSKFNKIYEFNYNLNGTLCSMLMTSVSGHLLNYEFPSTFKSWNSSDPVVLFDAPITKSVIKDGESILRTLQREVLNCQKLILWTDCDREGENIGVEIIDVCREIKPDVEVLRARFSEITPVSIQRAINQLSVPDYRVSSAVDARQELDLRIGAAFTRFQTLRLQRVFPRSLASQLISYGSCQFPTLGFVVERFREVDRFVPESFWRIVVTVERDGKAVDFQWKRGRLFDEDCCRAHYSHIMENRFGQIVDVTKRPKSRRRPVALDTVEMEKLSTRKLHIGAKKAMQLAERLYSRGFISYPRTETNIFPVTMDLASLVQVQTEDSRWSGFSSQILARGVNPRNGKSTDKAHPPIHPLKTGFGLQGDEARLFELITRHFLACLSADAQGAETVVQLCVGKPSPPTSGPLTLLTEDDGEFFEAKGLVITEANYLDVYIYDRWVERDMPNFTQGDWILPTDIEMLMGQTSPPPLLTEADLIALMDRHGIGTDATHAEHIETIKQRLYVGLEDSKFLVPGQLGMGLVEGYDAMGLDMSKPKMRAELEADLKLICDGRSDKETVLRRHIEKYKELFQRTVAQASLLDRTLASRLEQSPEIPVTPSAGEAVPTISSSLNASGIQNYLASCPSCSQPVVLRQRRNTQQLLTDVANNRFASSNPTPSSRPTSWFLSCSGYPQCRYAVWFPESVTNVRVASDNRGAPYLCSSCTSYALPFLPAPTGFSVNGPLKLAIRLRQNCRLPNGYHQDDEDKEYITCIFCDTDLHNALGIRISPSPSSAQPHLPAPLNPTYVASGVPYSSTIPSVSLPSASAATASLPVAPCELTTASRPTFLSSNADNQVNTPSENTVLCNCGCPAVVLTVRKAGPNQGRLFYRCGGGQASSCDFFQWKLSTDAAGPPASSTQIPPYHTPRYGNASSFSNLTPVPTTPVGSADPSISDGTTVLCRCGEPAKLLRVTKPTANQGREFYGCPNGRAVGEGGSTTGCGFFMWADAVNSSDFTRSSSQANHSMIGARRRGSSTVRTSISESAPSVSLGHVPMWPPPASVGLHGSSSRRSASGSRSRGTTTNRRCGLCGEIGHTRNRCTRQLS